MKIKAKRSSRDNEGPALRVTWRDSHSLIASWELTERQKEQIEKQFAIPIHELPFVLRLYDVTERMVMEDGQDHYVDFDINYEALKWILYGVEEGRKYCVDFGVRMVDGRFYSLNRSTVVSLHHNERRLPS
ncbi:hypothetical protein BSNK01_13350 [Bacillaceae bacterium]